MKKNEVHLVRFGDINGVRQIEVFLNGKFLGYGMKEIGKTGLMHDRTFEEISPHIDGNQRDDFRAYLKSFHYPEWKGYDMPSWLSVENKAWRKT